MSEKETQSKIWLNILSQMTGIAQSGLYYSKDPYDQERYHQLFQLIEQLLQLKQIDTEVIGPHGPS